MGAQVDGIGSNVMTVHGRDTLGGADHTICPDHIEVGSFMALAAATGGDLRIRDTDPDDLYMIRRQLGRLGLQTTIEGRDVLVPPEQHLRVRDDLGDAIAKIDDGPWPAFPAERVTTPRARSAGTRVEMRVRAARGLKDPVFWNSSALKCRRRPNSSPRVVADSVGVRCTRPARRRPAA